LTALGVKVDDCLPVVTEPNQHSIGYIQAKRQRMGHALPGLAADESSTPDGANGCLDEARQGEKAGPGVA
jgi:hypothetical protein